MQITKMIEVVKEVIPCVKTVFDIGAKHGDYAGEFERVFQDAMIYAFEPAPANFNGLTQMKLDRVVPIRAAVLQQSGRVNFNLYTHPGSHSILSLGKWDEVELEKIIIVDAISVDDFCQGHGISQIDILKVDVEGAELEVLRGAVKMLGHTNVVIAELIFYPYFDGQSKPQDVIDFLVKHGMTMIAMFPIFYMGEVRYADAVFVR